MPLAESQSMSRKPKRKLVNKWSRKLHRYGAVFVLLPTLVVIVSGLFLQLKKQSDWIQPPTHKGAGGEPTLSLSDIYTIAKAVPEAGFESWDDINRFDFRPSKGVVKVRGKNRWEVQIDTITGDVVQVAYRRSDIIENIHDGSWFHDRAKLWLFLPNGVVLLALWLTGVYLWILPIWSKRAGRKSRADLAVKGASIPEKLEPAEPATPEWCALGSRD